MVILKKIVILKEYQKSQCSGIVKFENFAGRTSCFVRVLGVQEDSQICIKCGDDIMYCGDMVNGEIKFDKSYDLNKIIRVVVMQEGGVVCLGSNYGKFAPGLLTTNIYEYLSTKNSKQTAQKIEDSINTQSNVDNISQAQSQPTQAQSQYTQEEVEIQQSVQSQGESSIPTVQNTEDSIDNKSEQINIEAKDESQEIGQASYDIDMQSQETYQDQTFYKKIEKNMQELFERYEGDSELNLIVPDSKWVRVPVQGEEYYVVGLIYQDEIPNLICYGVPDKDSSNPPHNAKECRQWLELEKGGRGYWMMYQSAKSGQTLTTQII